MEGNRRGDISELRAATWLMEQNWEVFRNMGCTGPVDLVGIDPEGVVHKIDVKTAGRHSHNTTEIKLSSSKPTEGVDVVYLYVYRNYVEWSVQDLQFEVNLGRKLVNLELNPTK